jgi:regulator of replication initiation timing
MLMDEVQQLGEEAKRLTQENQELRGRLPTGEATIKQYQDRKDQIVQCS